jgi:hypothetical protein
MASSMYLPWVHFERMKSHLGVSLLWPGDFGLPRGRFFSVPWVIDDNYIMPSPSIGTGVFPGLLPQDDSLWLRQLEVAGFWSGGKSPIEGTYMVPAPFANARSRDLGFGISSMSAKNQEVSFRGLIALKSPRLHPLGKGNYCLFNTLGVGSLKVLEVTQSIGSEAALGITSYSNHYCPSLFFSGHGRLQKTFSFSEYGLGGSVCYLKC